MKKNKIIVVKGISIATLKYSNEDFISLTDIARNKNEQEPKDVVKNRMRSRTTIEFLGIWEQLNNPGFKGVEFDSFLFEAGSNSFTLSPAKWIEATNARGIISRRGNNGGTFAHKDIAFEFASLVSAGFKLYLIKEFQRLKEDEASRLNLEWNLQRTLAKVNYRIHTDAIKENIIPTLITKEQASFIYASEADMLNMALFGKTAQQWRNENQGKEVLSAGQAGLPAGQAGNIRLRQLRAISSTVEYGKHQCRNAAPGPAAKRTHSATE
jgi:hypothetical protein